MDAFLKFLQGEKADAPLLVGRWFGCVVVIVRFTNHSTSQVLKQNDSNNDFIQFYKAVKDFKPLFNTQHPNYRTFQLVQIPTAKNITRTYVADQAPRMVALPAEIQTAILSRVDEENKLDADVFDEATDYALMQMAAESFPRFTRTKIYQKIRKYVSGFNWFVTIWRCSLEVKLAHLIGVIM